MVQRGHGYNGYEANLISTIVDSNSKRLASIGYEANLISTIVDSHAGSCWVYEAMKPI